MIVPKPVLLDIFSYLDTMSFAKVQMVCKHWREWSLSSDLLWKWMCLKRWKISETVLIRTSATRTWRDVWTTCRKQFTWSKTSGVEGILVSDNLKSAGREQSQGWFPTIQTNETIGGVFQVRVDCYGTVNVLAIGLLNTYKQASNYHLQVVGCMPDSCSLVQDIGILYTGKNPWLLAEGKELHHSIDHIKVGDIIGFAVDTLEETVQFIKNGMSEGTPISFKHFERPLFPAGSFASSSQVTIIDNQENGVIASRTIVTEQ